MKLENGEFILSGPPERSSACLRSPEDVIAAVDRAGLLPLFAGAVPGFSVEELTPAEWWWSGDLERDPWYWRETIAASGRALYGKFFGGRAGFVSLECFPRFANIRRDGYDFDALYEDGKTSHRCKKIMDCFALSPELPSYELKRLAGFGKGGEKNFDGTVTKLQEQGYLVIKSFSRRRATPAGRNTAGPSRSIPRRRTWSPPASSPKPTARTSGTPPAGCSPSFAKPPRTRPRAPFCA